MHWRFDPVILFVIALGSLVFSCFVVFISLLLTLMMKRCIMLFSLAPTKKDKPQKYYKNIL